MASIARGRCHDVIGLRRRAFHFGAVADVAGDATADRDANVAEGRRGPHAVDLWQVSHGVDAVAV